MAAPSTSAAASPGARVTIAVALVGLSGAWNGGTVGPVASEIADSFDVSLAVVGLLAGTFFFGACVVGLVFAAQVGERIGLIRGLRLAAVLGLAGNVLFAISPLFVGLAVGRVLPGLAFSLVNALGAVWARNTGGVRMLGVFGASIQLGLAGALLVGSALSDLGVDWRVGFAINAALAGVTLVAIPHARMAAPPAPPPITTFIKAAARHARVYRLSLLFISIYAVPMILSAWLIEYLSQDGDVATSVAGVAAFLLFGLSAAVRIVGARLGQRGVPHELLCGALALGAVGMAALTFEPVTAVAFASVVLIAVGFGIPYATALTEAQELYPDGPSEPVALMTLVALLAPIVVIPIVGHALSQGDGDVAFGIIAVFLVVAAAANLRRTGIPLR